MEIFRGDLTRLAPAFQVPLGPPAQPVAGGC
jgi:hypothetical protein